MAPRSPLSQSMTPDIVAEETMLPAVDEHDLSTSPTPRRRRRRMKNDLRREAPENARRDEDKKRQTAELEAAEQALAKRSKSDLPSEDAENTGNVVDAQESQVQDSGEPAREDSEAPAQTSQDLTPATTASTGPIVSNPPQDSADPAGGVRPSGSAIDVHPSGGVTPSGGFPNTNPSGGLAPTGSPTASPQPPNIPAAPAAPSGPSPSMRNMTLQELDRTVNRLMRIRMSPKTPTLGLGLPRDHVGSLCEKNARFVLDRQISEKMRSEMQGQLLTSIKKSRQDYQKVVVDGDLNTIHYLAPINLSSSERIMEIGAGRGCWVKAVAYTHKESDVIAADSYDTMDSPKQMRVNNSNIILNLDEGWENVPRRLKLIRIGDCITHVMDKVDLLYKCHQNLLPGGFVELQFLEPLVRNNSDGEIAKLNPLNMFFKLLCRDVPSNLGLCEASGRAKASLEAAGFTDVEIAESCAFIGSYREGNVHERTAATLCRLILRHYTHHVDFIHFLVNRRMMISETLALIDRVNVMLDDETCRFHLRFLCIYARKSEGQGVAPGGQPPREEAKAASASSDETIWLD